MEPLSYNIRPADRIRAIRATLAFLTGDELALKQVMDDTDEDEYVRSHIALIVALTEQAATYAGAATDAPVQLKKMLLDYAQEGADRG